MEIDNNCCTDCSLTCGNCYKISYNDKKECDICDKKLCIECIRHISKVGNITICKNLCINCFEKVCEIYCPKCCIYVDLRNMKGIKCPRCNKDLDIKYHMSLNKLIRDD